MKVAFKDFAQKITVLPSWFNPGQLEDVTDTLTRMNNWLEETKHVLVNVETLMLPYQKESVHNQPLKVSFGDGSSLKLVSVFRVWYKTQ